jgi:hypothetical protein
VREHLKPSHQTQTKQEIEIMPRIDEELGREIVPVNPSHGVTITRQENVDPYESYGDEGNDIIGDLLKFNKGTWEYGRNNEIMPLGTDLVANMASLSRGYLYWRDGKIADRAMGRVDEGFKLPLRNSLGDNDPQMWERDDKGHPKDPWRRADTLVLAHVVTGDLFTYSTPSAGGREALKKPAKAFAAKKKTDSSVWPIVRLGTDSYMHPDRTIGRVMVPTLEVVGWAPKDAAGDVKSVTPQAQRPALAPPPRREEAPPWLEQSGDPGPNFEPDHTPW